jgi:RimJ/RimL family protein N-acetyltransferase
LSAREIAGKILETERLILRAYTPEDFESLLELLSDPVTMQHYSYPYDAAGAQRWLTWSLQNYATHGFGWWALELKEDGAFLGDCGITMQNINGELLPEIGYHLHCRHWRRGYGKEAAKAVRDWAFQNTNFEKLYSYMTAGNVASWATAASIGMERIGQYEDAIDGSMYIYAISREAWERERKA